MRTKAKIEEKFKYNVHTLELHKSSTLSLAGIRKWAVQTLKLPFLKEKHIDAILDSIQDVAGKSFFSGEELITVGVMVNDCGRIFVTAKNFSTAPEIIITEEISDSRILYTAGLAN